MKTLRLFCIAGLLLLPAMMLRASNLLYGPWVHNVDEHGFTVTWVTENWAPTLERPDRTARPVLVNINTDGNLCHSWSKTL